MVEQVAKLYGGPLHGEVHVVNHDGDIIEITSTRIPSGSDGPRVHMPVTRGHYSRVGESEDEFEWDGWQV